MVARQIRSRAALFATLFCASAYARASHELRTAVGLETTVKGAESFTKKPHPSTRPTVHSPELSVSHYCTYRTLYRTLEARLGTSGACLVRVSPSLETLGFVFIESYPPAQTPDLFGCMDTPFHSLWISRDRIGWLRFITSSLKPGNRP
jgi:hypothetical protein